MAALVGRMERRTEKCKKEGETERWHQEQGRNGVKKKTGTQNPHQSLTDLVNQFLKMANKAMLPKEEPYEKIQSDYLSSK